MKRIALLAATFSHRHQRPSSLVLWRDKSTTQELLELEKERRLVRSKLDTIQERQRLLVLGQTPPQPIPKDDDFWRIALSRLSWLAGLLVCQSLSSLVLEAYNDTIAAHPTVVFFLTMLVGAGGNAGNQASVRVIRALAVGDYDQGTLVFTELKMALVLAAGLSVIGFTRVILDSGSPTDAIAITLSLFCIVFISVIIGALLPQLLDKLGAGASNAATAIQVVMDIIGVLLTCSICTVLLEKNASPLLIHALEVSPSPS